MTLMLDEKPYYTPLPEDRMSMDGWVLQVAFLVRWKATLVGYNFEGVFRTREEAAAYLESRTWRPHSGSKSGPARQNQDDLIVPVRVLIKDDRFIPFGDWFNDSINDILWMYVEDIRGEEDQDIDNKGGMDFMYLFGAPDFKELVRV